MELKKMIFGQPMPDADDPKYKARKERDIKAGAAFARKLKIDKAAAWAQQKANKYPTIFLIVVFGVVVLSLSFRLGGMVNYYQHEKSTKTMIQTVDEQLVQKGIIKKSNKDTIHVQAN